MKMVLAHGNAPRSIGYQPIALLLSYTTENWRRAEDLRPNRQSRSICFRNSARASAGSLSKVAESSGPAPQALRLESASNRSPRFAALLSKMWRRREVTLLSGLKPPNPLQTGAGTSASFASESPCGRICICVGPLRRRRPELLGHAEINGPRGGTLTRNAASEARGDISFTTRGKWSLHEDLHLDFELRTLAS